MTAEEIARLKQTLCKLPKEVLIDAIIADRAALEQSQAALADGITAERKRCAEIAVKLASHPNPTWAHAASLVANMILGASES